MVSFVLVSTSLISRFLLELEADLRAHMQVLSSSLKRFFCHWPVAAGPTARELGPPAKQAKPKVNATKEASQASPASQAALSELAPDRACEVRNGTSQASPHQRQKVVARACPLGKVARVVEPD